MNKCQVLFSISMLILLLSIVGCSQQHNGDDQLYAYPPCGNDLDFTSPNADQSLLDSQLCDPPCWQGLVPGVSTRDDAITLATTSDVIHHYEMRSSTSGAPTTGDRYMMWGSSEGNFRSGYIEFTPDGTVNSIRNWIEYDLTFAELIAIVGEPDGYVDESYLEGDEFPYCFNIEFVWSKIGLSAVGVPLSRSDDAAQLQVYSVKYMQPTTDMNTFLAGIILPHRASEQFVEWSGFDAMFTSYPTE